MEKPLTSEEKLAKLISQIESYVPYVLATLPYPSNLVKSNNVETSNPDWIAIHKGRAFSSVHQLNAILELAKEFKKG